MVIMDPENLPSFCELRKNHKLKLKLGFYAAPSNLKIFSKAIKDEFNKLKFTYCSELNGLIMEFGRISSYELIPADFRHCINVALNVDVYIFRPPVGSILEAVVNQTSDNHISCLVHNLFNVSVVRPENQPYDQWPGSKIKKEDIINVRVLSFDLTKKLPHITGDIVNKNDRCSKPENELDNYSSQCLLTDKSAEGLKKNSTSLFKQLSSESELSDEMQITTSSLRNDNNKIKMSPICKKTSIYNRENIKIQLYNSTPIFNYDGTVNGNTIHIRKRREQLQKHLVKSSAGKLFMKQLKNYEKDYNSKTNQKEFEPESNKEVVINKSDESVNKPSIVHSSTIKTTKRNTFQANLKKGYKDQNELFVTNQSIVLPATNDSESRNDGNIKLSYEPKIDKIDLKGSTISIIDSDDQSSSNDNNYTKLKHSLSKQDDEKLKLDNSSNINSSNLITKKRKTLQSNDKNNCKNQIKNKVVQKQSSSTSDSESSSNENLTLSVKDLDQKENVNHEPEINKKLDLTKSEICKTDSDDQSSSDDDNYKKLKHSTSKQDDTDSDDKKLKLDNSVNVHSSNLITKKRKTFQSNDKKDCKNQIKNKVVQKQSSSTSDSESSSNENLTLSVKDLDKNKNVNHEPEISKQFDLTKSKICKTDSDDNYTKLKHSLSKQDNEKLKLDNSSNINSSNLITKKRKTLQSNDKKDCKNQIKNKVVQKQSSSTSDSESSSNENLTLSVKDLDQKENVNHEPEINKKLDLTKSEICKTNSDDQSSSDDDNYKKLKHSTSKQDDTDTGDKKLKLDNSVNVHSSNLITKKRKTFQSNDKKDCKNQIKNKVVQRQSSSTSDSESISNANLTLSVKDLDKKKNVCKSIKRNKLNLTCSKINMTNIEYTSSSDDDIFTKIIDDESNILIKSILHSNDENDSLTPFLYSLGLAPKLNTIEDLKTIVKTEDCRINSINNSISKIKKSKESSLRTNQLTNNKDELIKLILNNSVNIHDSTLSTKKKNTYRTNERKDYKKQIKNKVIKKQSTISSSLSDSESSCENIKLSVKDLNQKKNVNHEPEIDKLNLTRSKINMKNTKCANNFIADISKQVDRKPYTSKQRYNEIHSSDKIDSLSDIVHNEYPSTSKLINSNTKKHCFNMAETGTNKIDEFSIEKTPKKKKKQKSKKCNEYNLMKIRNNKDKLINTILEKDCSSSSVSTDNDIKNAEVPEVSTKNNTSNKQRKPIKKLDDKITKSQNATFVTTDKLSDFIIDAHTPASKLINSYTKEHFINMPKTDENKIIKLSNEKTPKNNKKQGNKKCTFLKSPKDNKSLKNLMKITNNKDKLIKAILEEDSSSVSTGDDIEFIKKNVEKKRLNKIKNTKVPEVSIKNNTTNKQSKMIKKSDDKIKKPQITTDELLSRKKKRSRELPKELLLNRVLNSLQDSSSCHSHTKKKRKVHNSMTGTNDLSAHINYDKSSSKVKKKKTT